MAEFYVGQSETHGYPSGGIQGNELARGEQGGRVPNRELVVGITWVRCQVEHGTLKRNAAGRRDAWAQGYGLLQGLAPDRSAGELQHKAQGLGYRRSNAVVELALAQGEFGNADSCWSRKTQIQRVVYQGLRLGLGGGAVDEEVAALKAELEVGVGIYGHVGARNTKSSCTGTAKTG